MLTYALPERRTLAELQPIPLLKQIEPPAIWTEATHPISSFLALLVQKYKYFWTEATPSPLLSRRGAVRTPVPI